MRVPTFLETLRANPTTARRVGSRRARPGRVTRRAHPVDDHPDREVSQPTRVVVGRVAHPGIRGTKPLRKSHRQGQPHRPKPKRKSEESLFHPNGGIGPSEPTPPVHLVIGSLATSKPTATPKVSSDHPGKSSGQPQQRKSQPSKSAFLLSSDSVLKGRHKGGQVSLVDPREVPPSPVRPGTSPSLGHPPPRGGPRPSQENPKGTSHPGGPPGEATTTHHEGQALTPGEPPSETNPPGGPPTTTADKVDPDPPATLPGEPPRPSV